MPCRAIRGAITADKNTPDAIAQATQALLVEMIATNSLRLRDIASAIFTVSKDLTAAFPAATARAMGWEDVPMLCAMEIPVPKSLKKCIRVMLLVNTWRAQKKIRHQYLKGASRLRPDIAEKK
jgi:chorismate mutase